MSPHTNWILFMLIAALYLLLCFTILTDSAWLLPDPTEVVLSVQMPAAQKS